MFVTDTIDAVYRPEDWSPESLLDQLAELVTDLPETYVSIKTSVSARVDSLDSLAMGKSKRRR